MERNRWSDRDIRRALASGDLIRLQRNCYVLAADWSDLWPESRHRIEVAAAFGEMHGGGGSACHESAAVVWNIPLYRHVPTAVHVAVPDGKHVSSRKGLRRHLDELPVDDVSVRNGIRTTTLERTVFDLARTLTFEAAVAAADAGLRQVAFRGRSYDEAIAQDWRERMATRVARGKGARGIRQAQAVLEMADGRAESPDESVARVRLRRLGFERVRLQVPVRGPEGQEFRVDVEIEDVTTFLEVDGVGKYEDEALRSGRTLEQVLLDEKRREDWIRGRTQQRFVRVESKHLRSDQALAARLAAFGIRVP
jgi:hypothetical protein